LVKSTLILIECLDNHSIKKKKKKKKKKRECEQVTNNGCRSTISAPCKFLPHFVNFISLSLLQFGKGMIKRWDGERCVWWLYQKQISHCAYETNT